MQAMSLEARVPIGVGSIDTVLGGGLVRRGVHEWFAAGDRPGLRLPPMGVLIHLAWQAIRCEPQAGRRAAVWIGRACRPHDDSLLRGARGVVDGRRPALDRSLLDRSIWIDASTPQERSWAVEQAARCPGVFLVVADAAGFNAALSRRVQLAAQGGALVLLARPDCERGVRSVAMSRWLVLPEAAPIPAEATDAPQGVIGEPLRDERGLLEWPSPPRWRVLLMRSKQPCGGCAAATTWRA